MAKEKKEKKIKDKTAKKEKKVKESKPIKNYFNQKTFLGVSLVGILVLVVVYVFVYLDFTQRTEELEKSNSELLATVRELEEYNTNMESYKIEIEEIKAEINAILDEYPADAREEDAIMLAVELQERNTIDFDAINMEEKEGVYTVEPYLVTAAALEGLDESLVFTQKHAVYVNQTTYYDLKSVIRQIYESDNRIGIDNIVYTKNEEYGLLEGNIDIYFYSLAGTDKEYAAPDIAEYPAGTSDPFRSEEIARQMAMDILEDMADEEGEDGAEENAE
ncbi:MAG: hypothetical protein K2P35_10050 [Lachnospiraceae bacterium]|nr:hypothetical protein [Lachnospiraceae bacterium]